MIRKIANFALCLAVLSTASFGFAWIITGGPGESADAPVRYKWNSGRNCIVLYPDRHEASCGSFSLDVLNEFRLVYGNPHKK